MTACNRHDGWGIYWPWQCSRWGGSQALSDICKVWFFQWRLGGGFLTFDCRGYGTPCLSGISLSSPHGHVSFSRRKLRFYSRATELLILTISIGSNIWYDRSRVEGRALGRHSPILIFRVKNVRIIDSRCICNGRRCKVLFEWPGRVSTNMGAAVCTALDCEPLQYWVTRFLENHSIIGCTAIRVNSALGFTVSTMYAELFAPRDGCLWILAMVSILLHLCLK